MRYGDGDPFWTTFWSYLQGVDEVVADARPAPSPAATVQSCLTFGQQISVRFRSSGLRSLLTQQERQTGLAAACAAKETIWANPELFPQDAWGEFVQTLDGVIAALSSKAQGLPPPEGAGWAHAEESGLPLRNDLRTEAVR